MNELSYTKNTFYLALAGVLSQIFLAFQKIILARYLKEEGMAIYQSAMCVYSLFLTLACGGMPLALTHFISKERSSGKEDDILKGLRFALFAMCFLGLLLSFFMFVSRGFFSAALKDLRAEYAIAILSPSVFIVAVGAFIKSFFEGYSNMFPCAVSQALESLVKLILAYIFTSFFAIFSAKYAASGSALAITLGEAFATILLFIFFTPFYKKIKTVNLRHTGEISKSIMEYAFPLTVYAIILSSLDLTENAVIRNSLLAIRFSDYQADRIILKYSSYTSVFNSIKASGRLSKEGASWLYGAFFGYAITIIRFPAGLLRTLSVSLFPISARHFAEKNEFLLNNLLSKIMRIIFCVSLLLCALIIACSKQLTSLIFGSCAYSSMLIFASPILVFAPLTSVLLTVIYSSGRTFAPFLFSFMSSIISISLCFILIKIPEINILGAALASAAGLICELLMSFLFIKRRLGIEIRLFP
ncbi:MAG: oligosaccharide flippase family protein [Firmicutes bacterium]|nr:oligosaccharide flippase family protein [Bacillota bacterium]